MVNLLLLWGTILMDLIDPSSGKTVHELHGHLDYSFASAWNPDGRTFATGNQDKTCRVWDIRNLSKSVAVLGGNIGVIRSIRYTSDGKFMAMTEPADFIHIFDVESGYSRKQELDFFGEIAYSAASSSSIGDGSTRTLIRHCELVLV